MTPRTIISVPCLLFMITASVEQGEVAVSNVMMQGRPWVAHHACLQLRGGSSDDAFSSYEVGDDSTVAKGMQRHDVIREA